MDCKKNKRNIFQRLLGICITQEPEIKDSWEVKDSIVEINLSKVSELAKPGSGLRFENDSLRLLVVHFEDDTWGAFDNRCLHGKRRLDFVPGTESVQCCSVGAATYNKEGNVLCGNVKGSLTTYKIEHNPDLLKIFLN